MAVTYFDHSPYIVVKSFILYDLSKMLYSLYYMTYVGYLSIL